MTAVDGAVIGRVVEAGAALALGVVEAAVARDHRPVREAHDEGGVVGAAVGVDQQARIARQQRGRTERGGEASRHLRGADVVGDVALELLRRQSQGAVGRRNGIAGMVAEQDQAGVRTAFQDAVAVVLLRADTRAPAMRREPWL